MMSAVRRTTAQPRGQPPDPRECGAGFPGAYHPTTMDGGVSGERINKINDRCIRLIATARFAWFAWFDI